MNHIKCNAIVIVKMGFKREGKNKSVKQAVLKDRASLSDSSNFK